MTGIAGRQIKYDVMMDGAEEWTRGDDPRSFDPTGRLLYCCNQRADHLATFRVDASTGQLPFTPPSATPP